MGDIMTLEQLGNRIAALGADNQKLTVGELKTIMSGQKEIFQAESKSLSERLEAQKKSMDDLNVNFQHLLEKTATMQAAAGQKELTDAEKAGRALGAWYRLQKGRSNDQGKDFKAMMDHGMKMLTSQGRADWVEGGKWILGEVKVPTGTALRGDAVTGSVLVPTGFSNEVLRIAQDASELMGQVTKYPMSQRSIALNRLLTNLGFTWVTNEITAKTESAPTFEAATLECETAALWLAITEELMEDSEVPLVAFMTKLIGEAWGPEFDKQCMYANAAPFTGVLHASGTVAVAMPAGKTSLLNVSWTDLNRMKTAIPKASRVNAKFFMSSDVFTTLENMKDGNDRPMFSEIRDTIAGRPYTIIDGMPDIGDDAASLAFIAYGDPKNIINGDRVGMEVRLFDQTLETMQYDRIFLRARLRQAFLTAVPASFAVLSTAAA